MTDGLLWAPSRLPTHWPLQMVRLRHHLCFQRLECSPGSRLRLAFVQRHQPMVSEKHCLIAYQIQIAESGIPRPDHPPGSPGHPGSVTQKNPISPCPQQQQQNKYKTLSFLSWQRRGLLGLQCRLTGYSFHHPLTRQQSNFCPCFTLADGTGHSSAEGCHTYRMAEEPASWLSAPAP